LVVFKRICGTTTGLANAIAPAYELGVLLGAPAELSKTFLVLQSGKTKPSEVPQQW
jgi:hypothetical protein